MSGRINKWTNEKGVSTVKVQRPSFLMFPQTRGIYTTGLGPWVAQAGGLNVPIILGNNVNRAWAAWPGQTM